MKISLKGLSDELRGSAWPSSARAVRCPVKSGNERDLCPQLPAISSDRSGTLWGLPGKPGGRCRLRWSVCSESPGLHARNNDMDNWLLLRKETLILETISKYRLWVVTHPHDAGIPSNRTSSSFGEYVPAPCTHRPSNHSSSA